MKNISYVEYLWLDGATPTQHLRSKTRVLSSLDSFSLDNIPEWSFDGSSTKQAVGHDSDCILVPVYMVKDSVRGAGNYIVMCEVLNPDRSIHETNRRAQLRKVMEEYGNKIDAYIGFEQEYTLFQKGRPLGWPEGGYPAPQGQFYCGIGAQNVYGRDLVEEHTRVCCEAGLAIYGTNAEVMPGQWEFQIGYRGLDEAADPLTIADQLWIARYYLHLLGEKHNIDVSFENKPIKGDWNGAGMHTNFSTKEMRDGKLGKDAIDKVVKNLGDRHHDHISAYGANLAERLTGAHETCSIDEFRVGVSDRGASIRIPISTSQKGCGYIEDRRPGANADPYVVSEKLVSAVCY